MQNLSKTKIILFCLFLIAGLANAQDIQVINHETYILGSIGAEAVFDIEVINISAVEQKVFVVRTINTLPENWSSSLCFGSTCFSPSLDSVVTEPPYGEPLAPGDTLHTSLHVFMLTNDGTAEVRLEIGTVRNPTERTILDYIATTLSGPDLQVIADETNITDSLGTEVVFNLEVINISAVEQKVFVVRTANNLPEYWTSSLCFDSTCFSPGLDSVVTEPPFGEPLAPGDTLHTSLHVFMLINTGTAEVQLEVGTIRNPDIRTTLDFSATSYLVSVDGNPNSVNQYFLGQNYPNPFNPSTKINFGLKDAGDVEISLYNVLGSKIATIFNGYKDAGSHSFLFDGTNLTSGVYFYKISSNDFTQTKKMILEK